MIIIIINYYKREYILIKQKKKSFKNNTLVKMERNETEQITGRC